MSASVSACSPWPGWVNRSPQKKVPVVRSISRPQSQPCGTCGVSSHCSVCRPRTICSPSASARGGRSATSPTETIAATWLQSGAACGATASHSLRAPHSSASKCDRPTWRSRSTAMTAATASRTSGNIRRGPVWKSSGSSSTSRYWLKLKAWPPGRSTGVLMR